MSEISPHDPNPKPDWPIEIAPCRFPTKELGLQHGAVEVVPYDWYAEIYWAAKDALGEGIIKPEVGLADLREVMEKHKNYAT